MFIMCGINIYLYPQTENKKKKTQTLYISYTTKKKGKKYDMVCVYQQCMATLLTKQINK